ncbi:MAG: DUF5704 domain-containing protein [Clostridia bacterium]|nr:DUF5704 domain-containing protein [Clostridia bacterium]
MHVFKRILIIMVIISIIFPVTPVNAEGRPKILYGNKEYTNGESIHYTGDTVELRIQYSEPFKYDVNNGPSRNCNDGSDMITLDNPNGPHIFHIISGSDSWDITINIYHDEYAIYSITYSSYEVKIKNVGNYDIKDCDWNQPLPYNDGVNVQVIDEFLTRVDNYLRSNGIGSLSSGQRYQVGGVVHVGVFESRRLLDNYETLYGTKIERITGEGYANLYDYGWRGASRNDLRARGEWEATYTYTPTHSITTKLNATPTPSIVTMGKTERINVTLDSSRSEAKLNGANVPITARRYWASLNRDDLDDDNKGHPETRATYNIPISDVPPNTKIYCKVRVYSEAINASAEEIVEVPIGIKYLPGGISASLTATRNPTDAGFVALDSSQSVASLDGKPAKITLRRYWASTRQSDLKEDRYGHVTTDSTYNFPIPDVPPNTRIYCKVRVFSKELDDAGVTPATAEAYAQIAPIRVQNSEGTAVIKADNRGAEKFDVSQGIPSSEDLYINATAKEYLYNYTEPIENRGRKSYPITVSKTYNLSWEEDHGHWESYSWTDSDGVSHSSSRWVSNWVSMSDSVTVSKNYNVTRDFSYWIMDRLGVYSLDKVEVENDALPNKSETINPNGYTRPDVNVWHSARESDHITEPEHNDVNLGSESISGGRSGRPSVPSPDWTNMAENSVGQIKVKNDRLIFKGTTVIDDRTCEVDTPDPEEFPESPMIGNNVLYKNGITIRGTTPNGDYDSTSTIYYNRYVEVNDTAPDVISQDIPINPVTVHTPVVCNPSVWSDDGFNQEIRPSGSRASLILDRPSKINLPTTGQHRSIPGYGNKDYEKYTKQKMLRFPFDVYIGTSRSGTYLKANQWYTVPLSQDILNFYVPIWVNEGDYEVEFQEIAINDPGSGGAQDNANLNLNNYRATDKIPVRVIGRLFGFKITDISDYPLWQGVFRANKNTTNHSSNYYWVGTRDEDGNVVRNSPKLTLPILEGSHTQLKNVGAVKTGYRFRFELQTIGNYYDDYDCIDIIPKFYYVGKNGGSRQEVDLWYNEKFNGKMNYFVKVGSDKDTTNTKYIKLGDPYRNVPNQEISDTARILSINENTFRNQSSRLGWFSNIILSKPLRTYIGNNTGLPSGVDSNKVKKSQQRWYGEYYLPNDLYVVPKNTDVMEYSRTHNGLDGKESFWLKNGYVIVNFDIRAVKNKNFNSPYLGYWNAPNCNMWNMEGFSYNKTDSNGATFTLNNGDVIFYYANKKSTDDYTEGGSH